MIPSNVEFAKGKNYLAGYKYCSTCGLWFKQADRIIVRCPFCGSLVRNSPRRKNNYQKILILRKRIDPVRYGIEI